jgi:hypothetical protein
MGCLYMLLAWNHRLLNNFQIAEDVCRKSIEVLGTLQNSALAELNLAYCTLIDMLTTQNRFSEALIIGILQGKCEDWEAVLLINAHSDVCQ